MSFLAEIDEEWGASGRANRIDTYRFPLVEVCMGDSGFDKLRTHIREMNEVLGRGRIGIVYDVRDENVLNAEERQVYVEYFNMRREFLNARCAAAAVILDSSLKRGVLTALQWAVDIPFPVRAFAKKARAETWVHKMLSQ